MPEAPCRSSLGVVVSVTLLAACGTPSEERRQAAEEDQAHAAGAVDELDTEEVDRVLLSIGAFYREFGRLDDQARWAPYLCREPQPPEARFSESEHTRTHGHKLYTLYVKDPESYADFPASEPVSQDNVAHLGEFDHLGQVVVKEAWRPERYDIDPAEIDERDLLNGLLHSHWGPSGLRPAERDDAVWRAAERVGLFVMYQPPAGTPGTDEGWVYGTLSANGASVTAAGRLAACMRCHEEAGEGRLFGLASDSKDE